MPLTRYYQLLGLDAGASFAEVKRAFRRRAFELHPDHNSDADAPQRFIAVQEAYSILESYHRTGQRPKTDEEMRADSARRRQQHEHSRQRRKPSAQDFKRAQEKKKRDKAQQDELLYRSIYDRYSSGWRHYAYLVSALLGVMLGSAALADFVQPEQAEMLFARQGQYIDSEQGGWIIIDGFEYQVAAEIYDDAGAQRPVLVRRTPFFRDIARIGTAHRMPAITSFAPGMISLAPITLFFFLLPLFGLWYRRPDFVYTFYLIHYTLYIAPVLYLYFAVSGARILRAAGLW